MKPTLQPTRGVLTEGTHRAPSGVLTTCAGTASIIAEPGALVAASGDSQVDASAGGVALLIHERAYGIIGRRCNVIASGNGVFLDVVGLCLLRTITTFGPGVTIHHCDSWTAPNALERIERRAA